MYKVLLEELTTKSMLKTVHTNTFFYSIPYNFGWTIKLRRENTKAALHFSTLAYNLIEYTCLLTSIEIALEMLTSPTHRLFTQTSCVECCRLFEVAFYKTNARIKLIQTCIIHTRPPPRRRTHIHGQHYYYILIDSYTNLYTKHYVHVFNLKQ